MPLNKLQNDFKDLMFAHPDALKAPAQEFANIFDEKHISLPARLKVYRNNVIGSLSDTITNSFPLIKNLVGQNFMHAMARHYVLAHPPTEGCLNQYGDQMPAFIAAFEPAKSLPYLPDIARLEIAMNAAYYAPDHAIITTKDFAQILPEHLPKTLIEIGASVQLLSCTYPVTKIRDYCHAKDQTTPLDIRGAEDILLIHRPELEVLITPITQDEYDMLQNLQHHNLGDALEINLLQHAAFDIQAFLKKHLDIQTFSALK